nr:hypothetical protein Iba_chr02aCG21480 [Ipomoea batatas]
MEWCRIRGTSLSLSPNLFLPIGACQRLEKSFNEKLYRFEQGFWSMCHCSRALPGHLGFEQGRFIQIKRQ